MAVMFKVRNPITKKIEIHTALNANDLKQHKGWKIIERIEDSSLSINHDPQAVIDSADTQHMSRLSGGSERTGDGEDDA